MTSSRPKRLRHEIARGTRTVLRRKLPSDAADDYRWQCDAELARLDATTPLDCSFEDYQAEYVYELEQPGPLLRHTFAIDTLEDGRHIGNAVYYNVDTLRREAELGIMIGDRAYWDRGYGSDAVRTLVDYIFRTTGLERIYLKTLRDNTRAQKCFLKSGFRPGGYLEKDGYSFLLMEQTRADWAKRARPEATT